MFRTVSKPKPELQYIAEALLVSSGFRTAHSISNQLTVLIRSIKGQVIDNQSIMLCTELFHGCQFPKNQTSSSEIFTIAPSFIRTTVSRLSDQHLV